jgi:hypothetical protein
MAGFHAWSILSPARSVLRAILMDATPGRTHHQLLPSSCRQHCDIGDIKSTKSFGGNGSSSQPILNASFGAVERLDAVTLEKILPQTTVGLSQPVLIERVTCHEYTALVIGGMRGRCVWRTNTWRRPWSAHHYATVGSVLALPTSACGRANEGVRGSCAGRCRATSTPPLTRC